MNVRLYPGCVSQIEQGNPKKEKKRRTLSKREGETQEMGWRGGAAEGEEGGGGEDRRQDRNAARAMTTSTIPCRAINTPGSEICRKSSTR